MIELFTTLLAVVFAGYFALAGVDYGVAALLTRVADTDDERRLVLGALGPFLLGNEVWLVAAIGLLLGAFPVADGVILSGLHPILVGLVAAIATMTALVQLRSRFAARRRFVDGVIVVCGVLVGLGWGAALGAMLYGLPLRFGPLTVLTALTTLALFILHGAVLLVLRTAGAIAARARRVAVAMVVPATALTTAATATTVLDGDAARSPLGLLGAAVVVAAVLLAGTALRRGRPGLALIATGLAAAGPVVSVGLATAPHIVVDGGETLTYAAASAGDATLGFVAVAAVPLLPVLLAFQAATWWIWRRAPRHPEFY